MGEASREIMRQARKQVEEWTPKRVHEALAEQHEAGSDQQDIVLVDVREKNEWNEGYIPGALHLPLGEIPLHLDLLPTDQPLAVMCRSGHRAEIAASMLAAIGREVIAVRGGMPDWTDRGFPTNTDTN